MEHNARGVIFDLGGVIIASSRPNFLAHAADVLNVPATRLKRIIGEEEIPLHLGHETSLQFWRRVCRRLRIVCPPPSVLRPLWTYEYDKASKINAPLLRIVLKLKRSGLRVGLLSNIPKEHAVINRTRGLFKPFDAVILSCEVGLIKPQPEVFALAARKVKLRAPELLFIDDNEKWVRAARNYGFRALRYKSNSQIQEALSSEGLL